MTQDIKEEVEKILRSGDRDRAIRYLRDSFSISLQEATVLVEALEREQGIIVAQPTPQQDPTARDGALKTEVARLLQDGRKMEAIKHVRAKLHVGLKEALVMVDEVARQVNPNYVSFNATGCLQSVARGFGIFLMIVSFMCLTAAG